MLMSVSKFVGPPAQVDVTRMAMVGLNVSRYGGEVVGLVGQEQVDAVLRLIGRYEGLSLVQRFAYDHSSSTKYSSLYTLVDYTADSELVLIVMINLNVPSIEVTQLVENTREQAQFQPIVND